MLEYQRSTRLAACFTSAKLVLILVSNETTHVSLSAGDKQDAICVQYNLAQQEPLNWIQLYQLVGMQKTGCSGETRLVLLVLSSSRAAKHMMMILMKMIDVYLLFIVIITIQLRSSHRTDLHQLAWP